jgi:DNA primase
VNDFSRIKAGLNIQDVITRETGLAMKKHHLEACPFCKGHDCFSIQEEKQSFKCFQCDAQGDIFTFFEKYHNLDKREALERAANLAGIELTPPKNKGQKRPDPSSKEKIFFEAARYYHGRMLENGGRKYLTETRGHNIESLKHLGVGWSDGRLVDYLQSIGFDEKAILDSGLARMRKINGVDHLADFFPEGFAIFPHWDRDRVLHFTKKDPNKKASGYQLAQKNRAGEWRFYNQGALRKFNEIILVEGENDLLSVVDAGAYNVIGMIGQVSDLQIQALQKACRNKHLYLWMDNDEDPKRLFAKGKGYVRKICNSLGGIVVKVIVYPGKFKDPDEYLRAFEGDKRSEVRRLQEEAKDYVSWEILQTGMLDGLDQKLARLKELKIFSRVAGMVEIERQVYIEKLQLLGFSEEAIVQQLETSQDLLREISIYVQRTDPKERDPNFMADLIYRHFSRDGRFFYDRDNRVYLLYRHKIYEAGSNRPFNALMKKMTRLLPTKEPGRSVWESLASEGYNSGHKIDLAKWIQTDRATDTIYINMNSPNNIIFKVNPKKIEEIPNGLNDDNVLLKSSQSIMPVTYLPDTDIREGMTALRELIFNNLTCELEQRYLLVCWLISAFFLEFGNCNALMKFSGGTGSGKTTAARLLSLLLYGSPHLGQPSTAAAFSMASQNPLLVIDNLESADMNKGIRNFLLLVATGGQKQKRTPGTDTEITEESPKALICITAIEPLLQEEMINRTFDVEFSSREKSDDFVEDEVARGILKKRDLILSAVLKLIQQKILPHLEARREYVTVLRKEYRGHSKNRMDEYLAMLMLILDTILPYIPYYQEDDLLAGIELGEKEIRQSWIDYQNAKARATEVGSNDILKMLDGLTREYLAKMQGLEPQYVEGFEDQVFVMTHPEYLIEMIKTKATLDVDQASNEEYFRASIEFTATSRDICMAFDRFCKNNGLRNPYGKAAVFGARMHDNVQLLKKGGWEVITRPGFEPYFKRIKGQRFWKLRKTLIR